MKQPLNVCLAAATFEAGHGGIARVARLMSDVLANEVTAGRLSAGSLSYLDRKFPNIRLPVRFTSGSKLRFAWEVYKESLSSSHFVYDFLGMMRAHPRFGLFSRPSLAWIHGIEVWETTSAAILRSARRAGVLVCNSAYTRQRADRLHPGIGFHRAQLCWLGTEDDAALPLPVSRDRRPTLLILARIDAGRFKGHDELIDCWPRVVAAVPGARLVIVGKGSFQHELQRKATASPAAEFITFKGFVPDEEIPKVWDEATLFAMPSRGEGFGLVYIEAMRRGLPVIASIHDAAPEVNLEGVTGYNVDLEKRDELPERIIHLFKESAQAATLGRNGYNRWQEHFCYSAFKRRFLPILHAFLGSAQS